ncbi:hypothetical protein [Malacoplasma iowae]|uniref:hypothetical protein n=1 Tax=Malacoplasma iowae TaxID=2116 RepID=UPI003873440E|nr:hypothetical protein QX181_05010 [Malacoplasma iowae]
MNIILPIKPKYVDKIFNEEKKYEFRKRIPKLKISKIIIYETFPTKKIVGEFEIENILSFSREDLWEQTWKYAGIDKISFFSYFKDSDCCFAFKIKNVKKYKHPRDLRDYGLNYHPQSFIYYE